MAENKVALFTTTFYREDADGKLRKKLAREFAQKAVDADYHLTVVDGGTDNGRFIEDLRKLGVDVYAETQKGLGNSRRESLKHASRYADSAGIDYLCWSEPEKVDFIRHIGGLVRKMDETGVHLIVPSRTSMASYPVAQQNSEGFGNQLHTDAGYVDRNGKPLDTFFGPKMWRKTVNPFFEVFGAGQTEVARQLAIMRMEQVEKEYKSLQHHFNTMGCLEVLKAHQDLARTDHMMHMPTCLMVLKNKSYLGEFNILSVPINYEHPAEQTELETELQATYNAKRLMQLKALAEQFILVRRLDEKKTLDYWLDEGGM